MTPLQRDIEDAVDFVAYDVMDDPSLTEHSFELIAVEPMTVDELADYAGLDLSSGYRFAERRELIPYAHDFAALRDAAADMGYADGRIFTHSLNQLRLTGHFSPVIVLEGISRGERFREFGDGWGRVNLALALDTPLLVATLRGKGL